LTFTKPIPFRVRGLRNFSPSQIPHCLRGVRFRRLGVSDNHSQLCQHRNAKSIFRMHVLLEIDQKLAGFVRMASLVNYGRTFLVSFSYLCSIRPRARDTSKTRPRPAKLAVNPELSGSPSISKTTGTLDLLFASRLAVDYGVGENHVHS
jgi:hypothetical protein